MPRPPNGIVRVTLGETLSRFRSSPDTRADGARRDGASMTMTDTAWLILAVAVGMLLAAAWVSRERAIHRRRRRRSGEKETRE